MADTYAPRPARLAALACAGLLATLAGCASVADDATTAKTVKPTSATTDIAAADGTTTEVAYAAMPAAKPGTENTAEALPTPIVAAGDLIGRAQDLAVRYGAGMTNHVHLELTGRSGGRLNPLVILPSMTGERSSATARGVVL